ncbi:MAG: glycosyltransferase family 2 protein [Cyclobacteriaceae bacterium]|nr:glycosyltransferase family 2 protein [Cyclobacteriaceae bacterium]
MPRLTILMPAFNAATFIQEAVDSLLTQTFPDFELWIIDDGSRDDTRNKIDLFSDKRIKRFYFDDNRGRVFVINQLISLVATEFVSVTDADDVSGPTRLQCQINLLDQDPEMMMCGTSYLAIDEKGIILREMFLLNDYSRIYELTPRQPQFHGPTTIMRMSIFKNIPEFYRAYFKDNRADADLAARIVDAFKAINVTEPLYFYRIRPDSLSRRNYTIRFAILDSLISQLSQERRASGADSLMRGNQERIRDYESKLSAKFTSDPARIHQQAAFYNLYWKVNDVALLCAWVAFRHKPFHLKSIFLLLYVLAIGGFNEVSKKVWGVHYKKAGR